MKDAKRTSHGEARAASANDQRPFDDPMLDKRTAG
jgi:hypothetical protein